jgi:hypothetical protein
MYYCRADPAGGLGGHRRGQLPLSVSTDRIAYPAMRIARLLGAVAGEPVDRTGAGRIVEGYPAAALRVWGLPHPRVQGCSRQGAARADRW